MPAAMQRPTTSPFRPCSCCPRYSERCSRPRLVRVMMEGGLVALCVRNNNVGPSSAHSTFPLHYIPRLPRKL